MKKMFKKGFDGVRGFVKEVDTKDWIQLGIMGATVLLPMVSSGICEAATTTSMPWSTGVTALETEISGPLPKIAGILAVAVTGMMMAFGEMQGMAKKGVQITFGLAIAISSASMVATLTGGTANNGTLTGLLF